MDACIDLTVAEVSPLKWFLAVIGVLLWHIALSDVARRRTTPRTDAFFRPVRAIADLTLVVITLAGITLVLLALVVRPGAD